MTTNPPRPGPGWLPSSANRAGESRVVVHRAPFDVALVKNLLGVLLLLAGVGGVLTAAWLADPLLGLAVTSVPVGAAGWRLATSEA